MVPCQLNFPFPRPLSFSSSLLSSSSFFSWSTDSSSSSLLPVKWSSSWCPKRRRMRSQEWGWMWTHGPCSSVSGRIPGTEWPVVFDFQPSSQTRVISLKSWKLWKPQRERKSWHLKNRTLQCMPLPMTQSKTMFAMQVAQPGGQTCNLSRTT